MKKRVLVGSLVIVLVASVACMGAQTGQAIDSTAWINQDLSEVPPGVTFDSTEEAVKVNFYSKGNGIPPLIAAGLGADVSVMAGVLVGDYSAVEGFSLLVAREGLAEELLSSVDIKLKGITGATWTHCVTPQLSNTSGESCVVNVSLDPSLWSYGGMAADSSGRCLSYWNRDIANVTEVKLVIGHKSFDAETVSVSDFRLVGEGFISDPALLQLVREHFDADISNSDQLTAAQRAQDSDRDGRNDLMQLLDGEDPGLYVEILGVDSQGRAMLRWPGVKGRSYRVERTQDLTSLGNFESVPIDDPVANQVGDMERTDNSPDAGDGLFIYRTVKE